jgi:MSHA pilin protein MshD
MVPRRFSARGFTLVELVIAIVIVALSAAAILGLYSQIAVTSADPLLRAQARAIAEAYMDEITLARYENPDDPSAENGNGGESGQACGTGGSSDVAEGEDRGTYDDVWDYHSINMEPPTNQILESVSGLDDYTVDVKINGDQGADERAQIVVCVAHDSGRVDYRLVSERWPL